MTENTYSNLKSPVNKARGILNSDLLRLAAIFFMLLDHIWATYMSFGDWMTHLGRLAFPIFAFQISEGYVHTKNFKKYALRLLSFALISELPFNLFYSSRFFNPYHQNVLFTLLLGLCAIRCIDSAKSDPCAKSILKNAGLLLLIAAASVIGFTDYGFLGVLTVVMFYVCRLLPLTPLFQLAGMLAINIFFFEGQVIPLELFGSSFELPVQSFAVFALIPIWLYNGKKGSSSKILQYSFYAFYPAHMLILYLIRYFA